MNLLGLPDSGSHCAASGPSNRPQLAQNRYGRFMGAQPLFKNDKAEQDLMIVVSAGGMLLEELSNGVHIKVLIDSGAAIQDGIDHPAIDGIAEPVIYDIGGESALRTL